MKLVAIDYLSCIMIWTMLMLLIGCNSSSYDPRLTTPHIPSYDLS